MFNNKKLIITILLFLLIFTFLYATDRIPFVYNGDSLSEVKADLDLKNYGTDVNRILQDMTIEEKVGQMFMGCFYTGTPTAETVEKYHLGSILLFGASFEKTSKEKLSERLSSIDTSCTLKPIIAVDEEGGTVTRASSSKTFRSSPFVSPRKLYALGGLDAIIKDAHEKNAFLSNLGIDLNLAPVCDISKNPKDFMYSRSLGQDAQTTSLYAKEIVSACLEDEIGCALKHFPGYGNSADTHKGLVVDNRSLKQLKSSDLLPFKAGIDAGAPAVLVSHNIVKAIDSNLPASLSPAVHRLLREGLNFDGVIITDDLSMDAINNYFPEADSAVTAVLAGNDILCTGDYKKQYTAVLNAVLDGDISEKRIDSSVKKILLWKINLKLIATNSQDSAE